jgi:chemotaxis protein MotA
MDRLSLIGLFLALASLVGGSILKGAGLASLWSPAAFVIVIVGYFGGLLVLTSASVL